MLLCGLICGCEDDFPIPKEPPPASPSTRSAASLPLAEAVLPCEPPHGGCLCPMDDGRGYVEWVVETGRLYYLGPTCEPLEGVQEALLLAQSPTGPQQVDLADCRDEAYPSACTLAADSDGLRRTETVGVVRFTLKGEPCRAFLRFDSAQTRAAGVASPWAQTRPGT